MIYNIQPEYCQYGQMVGTIATFLNSRQPTLAEWFINAYNVHCTRFLPAVYSQLHMVNSLWNYVLSILATHTAINVIEITNAFTFPEELSLDTWMAAFEKHIFPILENNIDHILEVS